jgi:hypothetical protein
MPAANLTKSPKIIPVEEEKDRFPTTDIVTLSLIVTGPVI